MTWFDEPLLAIETSCDETSCAVIQRTRVLSNVVSSQAELHRKWGGVVPEAAARAHVEAILPAMIEAIDQAGLKKESIRAVAVTNRPGLVGALSVGVTAAKAFAFAKGVPLIGVNHLEGHLLSVFLEATPEFPYLALMVSGGHTELVWVEGFGRYKVIGQTIDDAAGEAFDKSARVLGLGYPGGAAIQAAAETGQAGKYRLPVAKVKGPFDSSFSGLKTAVLRLTETEAELHVPSAALAVQSAIVEALVGAVSRALEERHAKAMCLVGGVAANLALRQALGALASRLGLPFFVPAPTYCTDNAAMIGLAGSWRLALGERSDWGMDADSQSEW